MFGRVGLSKWVLVGPCLLSLATTGIACTGGEHETTNETGGQTEGSSGGGGTGQGGTTDGSSNERGGSSNSSGAGGSGSPEASAMSGSGGGGGASGTDGSADATGQSLDAGPAEAAAIDAADATTADATAADATDAPQMSQGDAEAGSSFTPDVLDNGGFEIGIEHSTMPGWTNQGTNNAAYVEYAGSRNGLGKLGHWLRRSFTVTTHQIVGPIPNGNYTFSIWINRDSRFTSEYIFARSYSSQATDQMTADTSSAGSTGWTQIVITGIPVTNQQCDVGIYSETGQNDVWANIDDITFTKDP